MYISNDLKNRLKPRIYWIYCTGFMVLDQYSARKSRYLFYLYYYIFKINIVSFFRTAMEEAIGEIIHALNQISKNNRRSFFEKLKRRQSIGGFLK